MSSSAKNNPYSKNITHSDTSTPIDESEEKFDWRLEQLALTTGDQESLDEQTHKRLESLRQHNEQVLNEVSPQLFVKQLEDKRRRLETSAKNTKYTIPFNQLTLFRTLPAAAGLAAALFIITPKFSTLTSPTKEEATVTPKTDPGIRLKGKRDINQPQLLIYKVTNQDRDLLSANDHAEEGSVLQIAVRVSKPIYGIIFSVDGRGYITAHMPDEPNTNASFLDRGRHFSPSSFELDDEPNFERFFLVTSAEHFSMNDLRAGLLELSKDPSASLNTPETLKVQEFLVRKTPRSE